MPLRCADCGGVETFDGDWLTHLPPGRGGVEDGVCRWSYLILV